MKAWMKQNSASQATQREESPREGEGVGEGEGEGEGEGNSEADVAPRPDGDGQLLLNDWVQVGRFMAGLDILLPGSEFQRSDCSPIETAGDGQMLVNDWVQAGRYVAGLDAPQSHGCPRAQ